MGRVFGSRRGRHNINKLDGHWSRDEGWRHAGGTLDLTDDETADLAALLRRTIAADPFPMAPRLEPIKAILSKIDPPREKPPPLPPLPSAPPKRRRR